MGLVVRGLVGLGESTQRSLAELPLCAHGGDGGPEACMTCPPSRQSKLGCTEGHSLDSRTRVAGWVPQGWRGGYKGRWAHQVLLYKAGNVTGVLVPVPPYPTM